MKRPDHSTWPWGRTAAVLLCTMILSAATLRCDAVRVERFGEGAGGGSAAEPVPGVVVLFGATGLSRQELDRGARAYLDYSSELELADVAAGMVAELETVICHPYASSTDSGCSAMDAEADAAVMDSRGRFGAVVGVRNAQHPVLLARLVAETPFMTLVGDGAVALAGGVPPARRTASSWFALPGSGKEPPSRPPSIAPPAALGPSAITPPPTVATVEAGASDAALDGRMNDGGVNDGAPETEGDAGANAPFPAPVPPVSAPPTTASPPPAVAELGPARPTARPVGATGAFGMVVRVGERDFAAAVSTAGTLRMPQGRMTSVPVMGATVFAGPKGAVAATGDANYLVMSQLARQIYLRIAGGASPQEAAEWAVGTAPSGTTVHVVVMDSSASFVASNRRLPTMTVPFSQVPDTHARALRGR